MLASRSDAASTVKQDRTRAHRTSRGGHLVYKASSFGLFGKKYICFLKIVTELTKQKSDAKPN